MISLRWSLFVEFLVDVSYLLYLLEFEVEIKPNTNIKW